MPITRENFSLTELLHDVVQEFELEARRQGVQLKFAGQPRQALVCADIGLVQRVLENLIRNALEHTPPGGSVVLDLESQAEEIAISVSDTGCGISENELENIFERYFTASSARSDQGDSSGLGLAIVKGILDLHGSRINVSSGVGKGTRFDFSLPTASAT